MEFFNSAIEVLQTLVVALGAGLGVWCAINLLEGCGNDNPGSKSQGMKQLMAGGGCRPVHIVISEAIVAILFTEGEADERDFTVSWQQRRSYLSRNSYHAVYKGLLMGILLHE